MSHSLEERITSIKGVGLKKEKELNNLGIFLKKDLLFNFPKKYKDFSKLFTLASAPVQKDVCIKALIARVLFKRLTKNRSAMYYRLLIYDETGEIFASYFTSRFSNIKFKVNEDFIFFGKITENKNRKKEMLISSIHSAAENCTGIYPVYAQKGNISSNFLLKLTKQVVSENNIFFKETVPESLLKKYNLCSLNFALKNIHFPEDEKALALAKRRLFFEEILNIQLFLQKKRKEKINSKYKILDIQLLKEFCKKLPFDLTDAQKKVLSECFEDIKSGSSMQRLLQGDVGSGKTVVAAILVFALIKCNNAQAVFMAPTEILARQHYNNLKKLFRDYDFKIKLLCSSVPEKEKREIFSSVENSSTSLLVGTQSLLNENLKFKNLGLVVTDEQHRFGVRQRASLVSKGDKGVHVLVMSATPIPRSLALILYADLDISILDEMPKGRKKVDTFLVDSSKRQRVLNFIKKNVYEGRQAFIVCPLVEETEDTLEGLESVIEYKKKLESTCLKDVKTEILHGKMNGKLKNKIMEDFLLKKIDVLISTTVIEVGIDVPNANIILVENAERLGLSQLHQLRGRVGRGEHKSYCILLSDSKNKKTLDRLNTMKEFSDGFKIAKEDLRQRGPGNLLGLEQHGFLKLKTKNFITSAEDLIEARTFAGEVINLNCREIIAAKFNFQVQK